MSPAQAAVLGAYLYGLAADMLLKKTDTGYFADEVADALPKARRRLMRKG